MTGHKRAMNRREFLRLAGTAGAGVVLAGCQRQQEFILTPETPPNPPATETLSLLPTHTSTPTPIPTATHVPPTSTPLPHSAVGVTRAESYTPAEVRRSLEGVFDRMGGVIDVIRPGARVGIKVNMTGSSAWDTPDKPPANEYFVTHPQVAAAMAELAIDAGARTVAIFDGIAEPACFEKWGYADVAKPLGAQLINLNQPDPYPGYARFPVLGTPAVYDSFYLHPILGEIDVLISIAKLKVHSAAGVTLSMKNLFGLAAIGEYSRIAGDTFRSAFHGTYAFDTHLPGVILDLNRACPIQLSVIDGIYTCEAGAGPWDATIHQIKPRLLLAGRDPVATDAVATAVMGFNPQAAAGMLPFTRCKNYLAMASDLAIGTHLLDDIPIVGESIASVLFPFKPTP